MEDPSEGNFFLIAPVECVLEPFMEQWWSWGVRPVILLDPSCCTARGWAHQAENREPGGFVGLQAQPKPFCGLITRICFVLPLLHFLLDNTERLLAIFTHPELVREREFANHILEG